MRAPEFWGKSEGSAIQFLLKPVSLLYRAIDRLNRSRTKPVHVGVPVICIGNVVAGGAGKTPVAQTVAKLLQSQGKNVHFLSRGYGGSMTGPVRVVQDVHQADEVGDEPLILANLAPTWVSKDRVAGARAAVEAGADVIVMDDGFQNPSLHKDINLLVIDGGYGLGNGDLIPAGPLRESWESAYARASAIVVVEPTEKTQFLVASQKPVCKASVVPQGLQSELIGQKVIAFAGIGRPEKFFKTLENIGADVIEGVSFPDHHKFSQDDIMKLVEKASAKEAALVTTRKDYVRLSPEAKLMTTVFDIDLMFENPQPLQALLTDKLGDREHA